MLARSTGTGAEERQILIVGVEFSSELKMAGSKWTRSKYETLIAGGASEMIKLIDVDSKELKAPGS